MEATQRFEKYVGQVFDGRYRIQKIIGIGGMAVVFEAEDFVMKRTVALKLLKDEINNDVQSVRRFINESRAVAMLNHPNIVAIYDVTVKDDLKYIVMENIRGITLKSYMNRKGVLNVKEALSFTEQILMALEHAHSKGIIHRDIKPQNIMLLRNGTIKVADFGIAKLPDVNETQEEQNKKAIGTVYYISPEQASGKPIDARSDLYSLGVMLYEMVTGRLPFRSEQLLNVAKMQVNEKPVPPSKRNAAVPKGVEQLILCAMEKDPAKRFQSAKEMLRVVTQLKNNPQANIKLLKHKPEKDKKKRPERQSRSMLPVIAGVATAFLITFSIAAFYVFSQLIIGNEDSQAQEISVRDFVGMTWSDTFAKDVGEDYYTFEVQYQFSETEEKGKILSQEPKAGESRKVIPGEQSCKVTLYVSQGVDEFPLDDYSIEEYREVELALDSRGLNYTVEEQYHDTIISGYVISTSPAAGSSVKAGDTITLYVSLGQEVRNTIVPDVVGMGEREAMHTLLGNNISLGKVTYQQSDLPEGTVISQSKNPLTEVPIGSTKIDLVVSAGNGTT
ncbi:MAG: protein kinase [Clostridiales bacterium]|nr:protein kinase [Clostridiales bacterium]